MERFKNRRESQAIRVHRKTRVVHDRDRRQAWTLRHRLRQPRLGFGALPTPPCVHQPMHQNNKVPCCGWEGRTESRPDRHREPGCISNGHRDTQSVLVPAERVPHRPFTTALVASSA